MNTTTVLLLSSTTLQQLSLYTRDAEWWVWVSVGVFIFLLIFLSSLCCSSVYYLLLEGFWHFVAWVPFFSLSASCLVSYQIKCIIIVNGFFFSILNFPLFFYYSYWTFVIILILSLILFLVYLCYLISPKCLVLFSWSFVGIKLTGKLFSFLISCFLFF